MLKEPTCQWKFKSLSKEYLKANLLLLGRIFNGNQQWRSAGSLKLAIQTLLFHLLVHKLFFDPPRQSSYIADKIRTRLRLKFCITCWKSLWWCFFSMFLVWRMQFHWKPKAGLQVSHQRSKRHFTNSYPYLHIHPKQYLPNLNRTVLKNSAHLSDIHK